MVDPIPLRPAGDGARSRAVAGRAPIDLDVIKDDLGIPASDTSQDAWLQRRIDGVWSRMEVYCARRLVAPPAGFVDDWGEIVQQNRTTNEPPLIDFRATASVFLRCFPVATITGLERDGVDADAMGVQFDPESGKLFALDLGGNFDIGPTLLGSRVKITYTAGWEEIPSDLYEALLGALSILWTARSAQAAGLTMGGGVSAINIQDVGSVDFGAANVFVESALRTSSDVDPLLGPFTTLLDPYVDHRVLLGSPLLPTTRELVAP